MLSAQKRRQQERTLVRQQNREAISKLRVVEVDIPPSFYKLYEQLRISESDDLVK